MKRTCLWKTVIYTVSVKVNDSEPISHFFLFGCLQEVPTINANNGCRRNSGEWILICVRTPVESQIQG